MLRALITVVAVLAASISVGPMPAAAESCYGSDSTYRVQFVLHGRDPDALAPLVPVARDFADDRIAVASGGRQAWHWACDVSQVVSARESATYEEVRDDVAAVLPWPRWHRYIVLTDAASARGVCGEATAAPWYETGLAVLYDGCVSESRPWGPLHELLHMLGAVQPGAPGSDGGRHAADPGDALYVAGPRSECAAQQVWHAVDCQGDTYYALDPAPGSWLDDNYGWNVANAGYLDWLPAASPEPTPTVERIAGASRWETAAAVSRYGWPDGAEVVYVASGEGYPDALAAGTLDGPLLLVARDVLPAATADELVRLGVQRVVIVGGTSAVSAAVQDEILAVIGG